MLKKRLKEKKSQEKQLKDMILQEKINLVKQMGSHNPTRNMSKYKKKRRERSEVPFDIDKKFAMTHVPE